MTQTDEVAETTVVEVGDFTQALRRRWWVVLLCLAVGVGAALVVTRQTTPVYRSVVKLVATEVAASRQAPAPVSPVQRVKSYEELLAGPRVATAVIDELDLDLSVERLLSRVEAEAVPDTVVLVVTVDDTDPARAQAIAEAIGTEFPALVGELEGPVRPRGAEALTVFEPATLPTRPHRPSLVINLALGLLLGAVVGAALAVLTGRRREVA